MTKRDGRRVHVTFYAKETKITLAWFEPTKEGKRGFKMVELHYTKDGGIENVEKSLDILVPNWSKVCVSQYSHSVISCELDKDPELFDRVVQDKNPTQYFVSAHTLTYCGGKSASMRLWDIEFNQRYAELIKFNKQASAGE